MNNEDPALRIGVLFADDNDENYKLAMLTALLCPQLCQTRPKAALLVALDLLFAVQECRRRGKANLLEDEQYADSAYKRNAKPVNYTEAVKHITGEDRKRNPHLSYAKERFTKFWAYRNRITDSEAKRQLLEHEQGRKAFTRGGTWKLRTEFSAWETQPPKKGKRGRVKNPGTDKRKRARPTPLSGLRKAFDGANTR
jgi:hypothetical protein